jgi:large subunit ribosomal protein L14
MQAVSARVTGALPPQAEVMTCDNSGAKVIKIFGVLGKTGTKGRRNGAGVGDMVIASVKKGRPDMRKQVVYAIIARQKKEYRRMDGLRVKFEDNAAIVLKDEKGNPKGTMLKGPIAKEVCERWPAIAKLAKIIV